MGRVDFTTVSKCSAEGMNSEDEICGHGRIFCKRENLSLGGYNQVPESAHDRIFFLRLTLMKTIEILAKTTEIEGIKLKSKFSRLETFCVGLWSQNYPDYRLVASGSHFYFISTFHN